MSLFEELKRRKVFRVAGGYVVAAWVFAQVADLVADNFNAPDWVMQMIITFLVAGAPVFLVLSWAFDLTSDGLRRTRSGDVEGSLVVSSKAMLALVAGSLLVLAAVFYLAWPRGDRSIAVLPFKDVSPGQDQAYLGDGIALELRTELQRLEGLRVAGTTSSIAYAEEGSAAIGEILGVESVLEGSVRQEGDRIRITVELTNVADGLIIWSDSFDRGLERIFEMQEEIATSVAGSLGVRLGVGGVNDYRGAGTRNVEAYEAYLKARALFYTPGSGKAARSLLDRAIELDPNYAVAWSLLASTVGDEMWGATPAQMPMLREQAVELARRGVQLGPESAIAHSVLGIYQMIEFDWLGSEQSFRRSTALLADRVTTGRYAVMLMRSGRIAEAQNKFDIAKSLEPLGGRPIQLSWHASLAQGDIDDARERRYWAPGIDLFEDKLDLAFNEQDPEALKEAIRGLPESNLSNIHLFGPVLAEFDSPPRIIALVDDVHQDTDVQWPRKLHDLAMTAAYFGDPARALKIKTEDIHANPSRIVAIWYPVMSEVRQQPEFQHLAVELNLVDYWRAYGWADSCRSLSDADFECS